MTLQYVPIIDLGPYFGGTAEGKAEVAKAVNQACRDIGFLVITEHQIPKELIERVYALTSQFFDLPMAEKRKADRPRPDMVRGYSAVAEESLSYSMEEAAPGDLKESFSIGPTDVPAEPYYSEAMAGPHFAPNVWPADLPGFQQAYAEYFEAMGDLARTLAGIKARCLVMSFTTDWRFSPERSRELVDGLLAARKDVSYLEIEAAQGHDAFLLPIPRYIEALSGYMNRIEVSQ